MKIVRMMLAACLLMLALNGTAAGFTLTDTKGQVHKLSDYRGKWVLINFWAPKIVTAVETQTRSQ